MCFTHSSWHVFCFVKLHIGMYPMNIKQPVFFHNIEVLQLLIAAQHENSLFLLGEFLLQIMVLCLDFYASFPVSKLSHRFVSNSHLLTNHLHKCGVQHNFLLLPVLWLKMPSLPSCPSFSTSFWITVPHIPWAATCCRSEHYHGTVSLVSLSSTVTQEESQGQLEIPQLQSDGTENNMKFPDPQRDDMLARRTRTFLKQPGPSVKQFLPMPFSKQQNKQGTATELEKKTTR